MFEYYHTELGVVNTIIQSWYTYSLCKILSLVIGKHYTVWGEVDTQILSNSLGYCDCSGYYHIVLGVIVCK